MRVCHSTHHTQSTEEKKRDFSSCIKHLFAHTKIIIFRKNIEKERKVMTTTTTTTSTSRLLGGQFIPSLYCYTIVELFVMKICVFWCLQPSYSDATNFYWIFPVLSQINVCTLKFPYLAIDSLIYMQLYIYGLHLNYHL